MAARFRASAQCRTPTPDARERFPRRWTCGRQSAGIAMRIGSALRSGKAHSPAVEIRVHRIRRKQSDLHRPSGPIETAQGPR